MFLKKGVPEGRVPLPCVRLQKKRIKAPLLGAVQKSSFFTFLLVSEGAVKSLFFGGHCVLIARLSFVVEKCRYSVFFGIWATMLFVWLLVR